MTRRETSSPRDVQSAGRWLPPLRTSLQCQAGTCLPVRSHQHISISICLYDWRLNESEVWRRWSVFLLTRPSNNLSCPFYRGSQEESLRNPPRLFWGNDWPQTVTSSTTRGRPLTGCRRPTSIHSSIPLWSMVQMMVRLTDQENCDSIQSWWRDETVSTDRSNKDQPQAHLNKLLKGFDIEFVPSKVVCEERIDFWKRFFWSWLDVKWFSRTSSPPAVALFCSCLQRRSGEMFLSDEVDESTLTRFSF